jgi:hypothetical protein
VSLRFDPGMRLAVLPCDCTRLDQFLSIGSFVLFGLFVLFVARVPFVTCFIRGKFYGIFKNLVMLQLKQIDSWAHK